MSTDRTFVGLDLGQTSDYTAIAIAQLDPEPEPTGQLPIMFHPAEGGAPFALPRRNGPLEWLRHNREMPIDACPACGSSKRWARDTTNRWACGCRQYRHGDVWPPVEREPQPDGTPLRIVHLHRYPLGTRYTAIAEQVAQLMRSPQVGPTARLLVDATGVGAPVCDQLAALGVRHERVTVSAGVTPNREGNHWRIPKRDLVTATQVLLQARRLKLAAALPEGKTLMQELTTFQYKISELTAHDSYGAWRTGTHDDLVFAVSLCCWAVTRPRVAIVAY